ncbi:hypothetical protein HBI23_148220 [Parastagonospora nodorum]|nr:hypothetical protein HBI23_148220 [Parastagonospora nodorum]KAH5992755.1 hypothetical protein HBI84_154270 [Parastagonospora nodorum]
MPILVAGDFIRLTPSYYDKIELSEPFCWIWPSLNDRIGHAKFNALVRYAIMVRGFPGNLSDMPFGLHEVFPQLCADLAKGQDIDNMKTTWEGGKRYGKGLVGGGVEEPESQKRLSRTESPQTTTVPTSSRTFENRIQYLCEEFQAYTSTPRADYEGFVEGQAQYGAIVKGLKKEVEVAECRVRILEAELEKAKAGEKTWKHKFEGVAPWTIWRKIMR